LPEQWAQRVAPLSSEEPVTALPAEEAASQPGEPQARKRQRKPRRREEEVAAAPAADASTEVAEATEAPQVPEPTEPVPAPERAVASPPVQIIEIGVGAEEPSTAADDGDQGQRKRGWWRRLIE
jgi:hypothetical protein